MCRRERALVILYNGRSTDTWTPPASRVPGEGRIKCNSRSSTDPTTNVRSSQISQYSCAPVSPRMEGICWWILPTEWGWQLCAEGFVPLQTALAPAPEKSAANNQVKLPDWLQHPAMHVQEAQYWVHSGLWKLPVIGLHELIITNVMWQWRRRWCCVNANNSIVLVCFWDSRELFQHYFRISWWPWLWDVELWHVSKERWIFMSLLFSCIFFDDFIIYK